MYNKYNKKSTINPKSDFMYLVDGTVPIGNGLIYYLYHDITKGFNYYYEGNDKSGNFISSYFTTKNYLENIGNCYLYFDITDDYTIPNYDRPVKLKYNYLNSDDFDTSLNLIHLKIDELLDDIDLHHDPLSNQNIIIVKDDSDTFSWYPIDEYAKIDPVLYNQSFDHEKIGEIKMHEQVGDGYEFYLFYPSVPVISDEKVSKFFTNIRHHYGGRFKSSTLKFEDTFIVAYLPSLQCESGPNYTAYTINQVNNLHKRSFNISKMYKIIQDNATSYKNSIIDKLETEIKELKNDIKNYI